jgi:peptide chain release factor 1
VLFGGAFKIEVIESRPGLIVAAFTGPSASEVFQHEAGGHRWQRVPPTEKRGRVQTSTITVAVLTEPTSAQVTIPDREIEWLAVRGHGKGGQHKNVTNSAVSVKHIPTGVIAYCQSERSQHQNRASALAVLRARVWDRLQAATDAFRADARRQQVGSGQRGDKRRTIRSDGVVDHYTGQRWAFEKYVRGDW